MPIDTSILGSYQPPKQENLFNTLAQFEAIRSAQQQGQMNAMQIQKAQREQEREQQLNALYSQAYNPQTGTIDPQRLTGAMAQGGFGSMIPGVQKGFAEAEAAKTEARRKQVDLSKAQYEAMGKHADEFSRLLRPDMNPDVYKAMLAAKRSDPTLGPIYDNMGQSLQDELAEVDAAVQSGTFPDLINREVMGAKEVSKISRTVSAIARAERAVDARRRPDRSAVGEARTRAEGANVETPDVAFANRPLDAVEYILDLAEELDRQGDADPAKAMRDQAKALMDQQRLGTTDDIREYRQAQQDGYRGSFMQYMRDVKPLSAARQTVSVGGKVYQEQTAKDTMDVIRNAPKARQALEKTNTVLDLLEKGRANTGLAAQFRTDMGRAVALFSKRAPESVTDTELLQALLGSDVFPLIQSLGIGARGLDTPAERDFLLNVMTGTIALDNTTLQEMTRLRAKTFEQAIEQYNTMLREGEFDDYMSETKRKLKPIQLPERRGATVKPLRQGAELQAEPLAGPTGRSADPTEVILPNGERMRFPTKKIADEYRQKFSLE